MPSIDLKLSLSLTLFFLQERLAGHGGIGLTTTNPGGYSTHSSHGGRGAGNGSGGSAGTGSGGGGGAGGPLGNHTTSHGSSHGPSAASMHQTLQSDFQPPYFPPPFHHSQSPPHQQQNHSSLDYLSGDPYSQQALSSLHHAPLHHYNQLAGLRPSAQDQLGAIHRSHRDADIQQHVVRICVHSWGVR